MSTSWRHTTSGEYRITCHVWTTTLQKDEQPLYRKMNNYFTKIWTSSLQGLRTTTLQNMQRFRGGLVCKAHRRLNHSSLGLRVINMKKNLIRTSIYDELSIGPSIQNVCTWCCFTMTNMIQVCGNFHWARVVIINTRSDEITCQEQVQLTDLNRHVDWSQQ